MKTYLLAATSTLVLLAAPAYATSNNDLTPSAENKQGVPSYTEQETKQMYESAKKDISGAAQKTTDAVKDTYSDIKASLIGDDTKSTDFQTITIDSRQTANGMIGKTIYNQSGEAVGTIHDIIVDKSGKAQMVIVADGELWGMGKKVAFNYDLVTKRNDAGDVIAPISETTIKQATEFTYDKNPGKGVRTLPTGTYSVRELLDAEVINTKKDKVADVDNITFRNGRANMLVVGFDKVLGVGGKKAVIAYNDPQLVRDGNGYDFQLSANKTAQFEVYKKAVN